MGPALVGARRRYPVAHLRRAARSRHLQPRTSRTQSGGGRRRGGGWRRGRHRAATQGRAMRRPQRVRQRALFRWPLLQQRVRPALRCLQRLRSPGRVRRRGGRTTAGHGLRTLCLRREEHDLSGQLRHRPRLHRRSLLHALPHLHSTENARGGLWGGDRVFGPVGLRHRRVLRIGLHVDMPLVPQRRYRSQ